MEFTLEHYKAVLSDLLASGARVRGIRDYLREVTSGSPVEKLLLLRHDVDHYPYRALRLAKLESQLGVQSTYYFRMVPSVFVPGVIQAVQGLGHEVGYHYETLDECAGDFEGAKTLFQSRLREFRRIADVSTVCSHGNARVKKLGYTANLDIFKRFPSLLVDENLLGEAFLSVPIPQFAYVADNGRNWTYGLTLGDIPSLLMEGRPVYASLHPDWWTGAAVAWLYEAKNRLRGIRGILRGIVR